MERYPGNILSTKKKKNNKNIGSMLPSIRGENKNI